MVGELKCGVETSFLASLLSHSLTAKQTLFIWCRTEPFISRITSRVKLVGPTISCEGATTLRLSVFWQGVIRVMPAPERFTHLWLQLYRAKV